MNPCRIIFILLIPPLVVVAATITTEGATPNDEHTTTTTTTEGLVQEHPAVVVTPKMEVIDSRDDIIPIVTSDGDTPARSSIVFFSASLSIFAFIGVVLFFRKCVTCPSLLSGQRNHFDPPAAHLVGLVPVEREPTPVPSPSSQHQEELLRSPGTPDEE